MRLCNSDFSSTSRDRWISKCGPREFWAGRFWCWCKALLIHGSALSYPVTLLLSPLNIKPKSYYVKFDRTAIPTSNGHISETKRDFLDPLVPKFSYDRGLSPTRSWKWPSVTFSPSFDLFQSEKPLYRGVPSVSRWCSLVRTCPWVHFPWRKNKIYCTS